MTALPKSHSGHEVGGRYRIVTHLGGGGFGQTYLAEDLHLPFNPRCVVKHLKPQLNDAVNLETAERLFESEAQVLYQLSDCDRIPRLFAHFEEEKEFYLVQEFIDGQNLNQELAEGCGHSTDYVILLLQDVLQILVNIHQRRVIHRDIKPSNLIRRHQDGQLVLIDFGAVKQLGNRVVGSTGHTTRTIAIGSPGYMPNEQFAGKPRLSSDIYALGMMGIQALTGTHPKKMPEDPRTGEILWRSQGEGSDALAAVLDQMVRYDFRDRYPSAVEALAAIAPLIPPPRTFFSYSSFSPLDRDRHATPTLPSNELFLDSECGINYHPLQALLAARDWRAADQETYRVMLATGNLAAGLRLLRPQIQSFPGRDLRTLDYLWTTYSNGRFGFSGQTQMWRDVGGRSDLNYINFGLLKTTRRSGWKVNGPLERFGLRVQWRDREDWLDYSRLQFDEGAVEGHLPAWHHGAIGMDHMLAFFARLEECWL